MGKEYISRDEMIEQTKARIVLGAPKFNTGLKTAIEVATSIPAADVVEVVRCGECIRKDICRTSNVWAVSPDDNWFCADGKRMDGGQDDG